MKTCVTYNKAFGCSSHLLKETDLKCKGSHNLIDTSLSKQTVFREIYCALCDKWFTCRYAGRHVASQIHQDKLKRSRGGRCESAILSNLSPDKPTTSSGSLARTPVKESDQEEYAHYRIDRGTLKKCPHQHKSILEKCEYSDGETTPPSSLEEHDCHWHVKQKLFETGQQQQQLYPDIYQPLDTEISVDDIQQFERESELFDLNNADESREERENRSNFYVEEIREIEFKHILDESDDWLVGCFGLNGPLRQYFSLYRAVSRREGERKEKR